MLTKTVQMQAHAFTKGENLPMCHGPGLNFPKTSLQKIGMTYDQSSAIAQTLKTPAMAM